MRDKVLKSDRYKQAVRDGALDSKTLKDYTIEDSKDRDLYEEIVEGFKALGLTQEDQEMIEALGSEEFSFEAMQERWKQFEHNCSLPISQNEVVQSLLKTESPWNNPTNT